MYIYGKHNLFVLCLLVALETGEKIYAYCVYLPCNVNKWAATMYWKEHKQAPL